MSADSRSARAERDALLDVVGIFAHDLSNPLQSITVLCELGLDDAAPGSDDLQRAQQCLEAADRMRALIHSFAGLIRSATTSSPIGGVVERVTTLFERRFGRHCIETSIDIDSVAETQGVRGLDFALLNLLLGAVATAADSQHKRYSLKLAGSAPEGADTRSITLSMEGADASGAWQPLTLSKLHVDRAADVLAGSDSKVQAGAGRVELSFPAGS